MTEQEEEVLPVRITVTLSPEAADRLKAECKRRSKTEGFFCPYGRVLSELIVKHLHGGRK